MNLAGIDCWDCRIPLVSYKSLCTKVIRLAFYKCHWLNTSAADVMKNTNSFVVQSQGPALQMLASTDCLKHSFTLSFPADSFP